MVGLEKGRQTELSAGLLLARQCCNCDNKTFSTYSVWFSSKFGPNSVTARSTFQFRSLLQLLTDIVPFESAEMLRVHINKVNKYIHWSENIFVEPSISIVGKHHAKFMPCSNFRSLKLRLPVIIFCVITQSWLALD